MALSFELFGRFGMVMSQIAVLLVEQRHRPQSAYQVGGRGIRVDCDIEQEQPGIIFTSPCTTLYYVTIMQCTIILKHEYAFFLESE